MSKATVHSNLRDLRAFFLWLAREPGYRSHIAYADADYFNLADKDVAVARARREPNPPTVEQVGRVLDAMPTGTPLQRRDRALVAFAAALRPTRKRFDCFALAWFWRCGMSGMEGFAAGDVRTAARGAWLFDRIFETGSVVLSEAGRDEAGTAAAHRYLGSPHTDAAEIVRALGARTAQACAGRNVVAVQDTTEISFSDRAAGRHGLGPTGNGRNPGFFLHPVVAVEAEAEAVLGVADASLWTRGHARVGPRQGRPVADKESHRWIAGTQAAAARLGRAASLIVVADQEGDIYGHFARVPAGTDLLVRARHDRALVDGARLRARSATWPVLARVTVRLPARTSRPAREAEVALRAGPVEVARPKHDPDSEPDSLRLHLVVAEETAPPPGADPLCWRLLTTRPVQGAEQAREMVRLYRLRWRIEEVFRTLKRDGLGLDGTQMRVPDKLFRLSALALGAAVRILQLVEARDGSPRPMQDVLDRAGLPVVAALGRAREGSTPRLQNPHPEGSLAWLAWIVARHGGWNVSGKPPGPKIMTRGWQRFAAALAGASLTLTTDKSNVSSP